MILKCKSNSMNLKKVKKKINSLYVHIPFCSKICPYCDFVKVIDNYKFKDLYIKEIVKDISFLYEKGYKFKTIYLGGGTPSILTCEQLEILLSNLQKVIENDHEFTIEANPESISESKLQIMKKYEVNRISIGIQSFNKDILQAINRDNSVDYFELISLVKKYIKNINVDFIYGLPNQTLEMVQEDLNNFIKLDVNHISTYSLILEEGTMFYNQGVKEISDEECRTFYDFILEFLIKHGFNRYEVSNFCKSGFESKHNLTYRKDEEYIAIGIGASGYVNNVRYKNSSSLSGYLKGERSIEKEVITAKDDEEYYLICNLRLKEGFNINDFKLRFNKDFAFEYKDKIAKLEKMKLVRLNEGTFRCTDEGIILLDRVLIELI